MVTASGESVSRAGALGAPAHDLLPRRRDLLLLAQLGLRCRVVARRTARVGMARPGRQQHRDRQRRQGSTERQPAEHAAQVRPPPVPSRDPSIGLRALELTLVSAPEPPALTVVELQRHAASSWSGSRRWSTTSDGVFADAGHELALVGGPVRDAMLGRPHTDLDFATSARPDDTERLLAAWARRDLGHGPRLRHHRLPARATWTVEVTTYRSEAYDPASRKPTVDFGDTLEGDLGRRDFTVNAMAVRLPGPGRRGPVRRRGRPRPPAAPHARAARRTRSPTTRCG